MHQACKPSIIWTPLLNHPTSSITAEKDTDMMTNTPIADDDGQRGQDATSLRVYKYAKSCARQLGALDSAWLGSWFLNVIQTGLSCVAFSFNPLQPNDHFSYLTNLILRSVMPYFEILSIK